MHVKLPGIECCKIEDEEYDQTTMSSRADVTPIECRENEKQPFRPGSAEDMVVDQRQRMETVGTPHAPSRCGAPTRVARAPPRSLPAAR